jgi:hypothetical protein
VPRNNSSDSIGFTAPYSQVSELGFNQDLDMMRKQSPDRVTTPLLTRPSSLVIVWTALSALMYTLRKYGKEHQK